MPSTEVCSYCIHKDAVAKAAPEAQELLAEHMQKHPCAYVQAGHCAVADYAIELILNQPSNKEQ